MAGFFDRDIEFLKGVGPKKAELLKKELRIFTFGDLLNHFPFRHEDRSRFFSIREVHKDQQTVQLKGVITHMETIGAGRKKRLVARFKDDTGAIELVWFKGISWIAKKLVKNQLYLVYGRPGFFHNTFSIAHPEMELLTGKQEQPNALVPVYNTTEKLKSFYIDSKGIAKLQENLLAGIQEKIPENLPYNILEDYHLVSRDQAYRAVHFPESWNMLKKAWYRLKFEEFFFIQLKMLKLKAGRKKAWQGQVFKKIPTLNAFYKQHLPFNLTGAQKKVIKEIYNDFVSGKHMNRLLQGDVGSGKTIVAFLCMLMAIDNNAQAAIMAPTEILAEQHFNTIKPMADQVGLNTGLLTGSTKKRERDALFAALETGYLHIIAGTHALLEENVKFHNLGLCVIDEQHRFGVAQRAKLWNKNKDAPPPHILVMTATPIPRTLSMTLYGDLDVSVIDELPAGRKPVKTVHYYNSQRLRLIGFIKKQIELGRQVYVVYPLIEESEKLDLIDLQKGYEFLASHFPFPHYTVAQLHGKMSADEKEEAMRLFANGKTQILVATTVIEVGVDVPNASVMIIENAERFGLSQLHQLRGRVGRGSEQSYCVLVTGNKLTSDSRERIGAMVRTGNGFEIAEADLKLRGPGDLMGTKQSGILDLKAGNLAADQAILQTSREAARLVIDNDFYFELPQNQPIKNYISSLDAQEKMDWSRIS